MQRKGMEDNSTSCHYVRRERQADQSNTEGNELPSAECVRLNPDRHRPGNYSISH